MGFGQCQAIVVLDRNAGGGRGGLVPPRRCRKAALVREHFCEVHSHQAEIQTLYLTLLPRGWEQHVARWEQARRDSHAAAAKAAAVPATRPAPPSDPSRERAEFERWLRTNF